jgi:hypothetical protein
MDSWAVHTALSRKNTYERMASRLCSWWPTMTPSPKPVSSSLQAPRNIQFFVALLIEQSRKGSRGMSTNALNSFILLSMAQAQLVDLVVNSSLAQKLRPHLPKLLAELTECPLCIGFWLALASASFLGFSTLWPINALAIGYAGAVLYELKQRFLPCRQCSAAVQTSEWRIR